jgi:geranylgeranyl pyrophosphate synthase
MSSSAAAHELLSKHRQPVEDALDRFLPAESGQFERLAKAMRYSIFAGGKRLRPALVIECCEVCGGSTNDAMPAACAVEMIHTYSLIHDDLPAMDDDDLRRGRPSCHMAFDEATAILAGDALLALAFETAAVTPGEGVALEVVKSLARAAGPECLVGGQVLDMETPGAGATLDRVEAIHDHKTADLLAVCCRAGALVGTGSVGDAVAALESYGRDLGHAFQIADDILDLTSTAEELGKTPGKDAAAGKATYPALAGIDGAKKRACELRDSAIASLAQFGERAGRLGALARFVVERDS